MAATFTIDLGERFITVANVKKKGRDFDAVALGLAESKVNIYRTQSDQDIKQAAQLIDGLIRDAGIRTKEANIVIPDSQSYTRILEMPKLTEKELISAIRYQADQFIPIPIENVSLDVEILYEDKKNKKILILLVAAAAQVIDKVTTVVERTGSIPSTIENEASASLRVVTDLFSPTPKEYERAISIFINFGFSSTSLYLFDHASMFPRQLHNSTLGYELFIKDIQANFNVTAQEAHARMETVGFDGQGGQDSLSKVLESPYDELRGEIERFLVSAKNTFKEHKVHMFLFGEGSKARGLASKLSTSFATQVAMLNLYSRFVHSNVVESLKADLPLFVPAIGGGLKET